MIISTTTWCLFLLITGVLFALYRASRWGWFVWWVCLVFLIGVRLPTLLLFFLYAMTAVWALFLCFQNVREQLIWQPLIKILRTLLPHISSSEKIALDAGDVWWDAELFSGNPRWNKLFSHHTRRITVVERDFLDQQTEKLCALLNDWQIMQQHNFPKEVWDYLREQKFFAMNLSEKYGGLGFSKLAQSMIVSKIATRSVSAAITVMVPNSLGPAELIERYGTDEQKKYYLPRLASSKDIPCFGLTDLDAGSDATAMTDIGTIVQETYEGKTQMGLRLTWHKRYITLAPVATLIGLACKVRDPDHLLSNTVDAGITVCLIPSRHVGVRIGKRHNPLGLAFMNGPIEGENVFIPIDWVVGGVAGLGQGWRMLLECLSVGRGISLPAISSGAAQVCYRATGAYAKLRQQFQQSIGQFEGIEEVLARIAGHSYIIEAARTLTASIIDAGHKPSLITAITKYHATELMRRIVDDAMDVHGGRGIQLGPRNYLGFLHQGAPISITVEGANILTRNLIIFGQGAIRCHPFLQKEIRVLQDEHASRALKRFDKLMGEHLSYWMRNAARGFFLSLVRTRWPWHPVRGVLGGYTLAISRLSKGLACTTDLLLLTCGAKLKLHERLCARLGDVLSYSYLASAVLHYYHQHHMGEADTAYAHWAVQTLLHRGEEALYDCIHEMPNIYLRGLLHALFFPTGRCHRKPKDKLDAAIAQHMQGHSELRNRLTAQCYIGKPPHAPIAIVEHAWQLLLRAEPLHRKIHLAIQNDLIDKHLPLEKQWEVGVEKGLFSEDNVALLRECEAARREALQVDAF